MIPVICPTGTEVSACSSAESVPLPTSLTARRAKRLRHRKTQRQIFKGSPCLSVARRLRPSLRDGEAVQRPRFDENLAQLVPLG